MAIAYIAQLKPAEESMPLAARSIDDVPAAWRDLSQPFKNYNLLVTNDNYKLAHSNTLFQGGRVYLYDVALSNYY